MSDKVKIKHAQIWEVITDNFLTSSSRKYDRPVKILKGEKLEMRYEVAWNFRCEDNNYFHATPEMILNNCKLIGDIWERVNYQNKANLEEILRLKLYDKVSSE